MIEVTPFRSGAVSCSVMGAFFMGSKIVKLTGVVSVKLTKRDWMRRDLFIIK